LDIEAAMKIYKKIAMNNFKEEPDSVKEAYLAAFDRVLRSGQYILGNEVSSFEEAWAKMCDVKHAVGVGNGMDAIEISLRAAGVGDGDEVVTTSMSAFATVLAILRCGATPVLADIEPNTGLMCKDSVLRCLSNKTKAILLVHLYGHLRDIKSWQSICYENDLILIEDCAQAHLARTSGGLAGSFGLAGAFSFYPTKNLGAIGDAGAIVTSNPDFARKCSKLRNYGQSQRYFHDHIGLNSRLDEIQAAILSVKLPLLQALTERRQNIAKKYNSLISNDCVLKLNEPRLASEHVYHLFVLKCAKRAGLECYLAERGVDTIRHYPVALHMQKPCTGLRLDPLGLSAAEEHAETCLSIPCHPNMSDKDVFKVIDTINSWA
jgi:dTDP-4-amino-4,6-dideoxygalactose transaminase